MNIVVITSSGKVVVRPDTTWERDNEDVFLPEFVNSVSYSPVFFLRVSKPGRSIGEKFASRYYDGIGFGLFLYPEDLIDGSEEGFAAASCLDHTSFLPFPVYNPITLGVEGNEFVLERNGVEMFRTTEGSREMAEKAIAEVSRFVYLRTGDIVAVELRPRTELCRRDTEKVEVRGSWCDNPTIEFKVVY